MLGKVALFCAGLTMTAAVAAQGIDPKAQVQTRVNRYREVGAAFKTINDQAKSGTLVKMTARIAARNIAGAARDQYQWFPAGSGPSSGATTKAKPAIWSDSAGFKKAQLNFQAQADLMTKAVETGDISKVQTQAKALGAACAACHRAYRSE